MQIHIRLIQNLKNTAQNKENAIFPCRLQNKSLSLPYNLKNIVMTTKEQYKCFIKNCTNSPNSVGNYSDFKRINDIIASIKGVDSFDIYSCTNTRDLQEIIDSLYTNDDFKSNEKKGGNQYSNALKTYMRYLQAKELFTEKEEITEDERSLQKIFYGAPGTGKSNTIKRQTIGKDVIRTTFHPDTDYASFIGTYKPTTEVYPIRNASGDIVKDETGKPITDERVTYKFIPQVFLEAYCRAWKEPAKEHFLVIEEINRGNCAQIFGDLFQLLDRNTWGYSEYPIIADNDMRTFLSKEFENITIQVSDIANAQFDEAGIANKIKKGEILVLPSNLYIWATMNTSDQSLFPIDSAFKRRWDWKYMPICEGRDKTTNKPLKWYINSGTKQYDWWSFLEIINNKIDCITNSEDKKLGYFFCKAKQGEISADLFVSKVIFYLWNDVFKDYGFDDAIFQDEDGTRLEFCKFYEDVNGKVVTIKSKIDFFLTKLGVKTVTIDRYNKPIDEPRFSVNNKEVGMKDVPSKVIEEYAIHNPEKTAKDIRDYFVDTCKSLGLNYQIVETEEENKQRKSDNPNTSPGGEITIPNGEKIFITKQWKSKQERIDLYKKFIEIANQNSWANIVQIED